MNIEKLIVQAGDGNIAAIDQLEAYGLEVVDQTPKEQLIQIFQDWTAIYTIYSASGSMDHGPIFWRNITAQLNILLHAALKLEETA